MPHDDSSQNNSFQQRTYWNASSISMKAASHICLAQSRPEWSLHCPRIAQWKWPRTPSNESWFVQFRQFFIFLKKSWIWDAINEFLFKEFNALCSIDVSITTWAVNNQQPHHWISRLTADSWVKIVHQKFARPARICITKLNETDNWVP